jgi:ligand-binding sensor domain-containing protein
MSDRRTLVKIIAGAACFALLACATALSSGAQSADGVVRLEGKVKVTKRDGGVPAAAEFTSGGRTYSIEMDEKGVSLAGVMHNESAEIRGIPGDKGGQPTLRILGYTDSALTAGHEFWRRMRCNACVVLPATRNSATPADLRGAVPVAGRDYFYKRRFAAWARDSRYLWAASDTGIVQVDMSKRTVAREYGPGDGLPDPLIYQLFSDGRTLWIAHRSGLAALSIAAGKIVDLPSVRAGYARVLAHSGGVAVVADTGTFLLKSSGDKPVSAAAIPTAARMSKAVANGIWTPHWDRRTAAFESSPVSLGSSIFVSSWGDLYEFGPAGWNMVAEGGYEPRVGGNRVWFLDVKGLVEYDPSTRKSTHWPLPADCAGRCAGLLVSDRDRGAWVIVEAAAGEQAARPIGDALARFDFAGKRWEVWREINGRPIQRVSHISAQAGRIWIITAAGRFNSKSAHPGMTSTTRLSFVPSGFTVSSRDDSERLWDSRELPMKDLETRLICGQDACRGTDTIRPDSFRDVAVGNARIFASMRLAPVEYFGGYWPCIEQIASGRIPRGPWTAAFEHHPEELDLQGEQPAVLNISNGELTRVGSSLKDQDWEATGHDLVLGLFTDERGTHWAVTEGVVGCFDEGSGRWRELTGPEFRWYWRATAALEEGPWLYIGSDRGVLTRMNIRTGAFERQFALEDRSIDWISRDSDGRIVAGSRPAPMGALPVQLQDSLPGVKADAMRLEGGKWSPVNPDEVGAPAGGKWGFRYGDRTDHFDKSDGNYLCGPSDADGEIKPRYYLKQAFFPRYLCSGGEGKRMWFSTFSGIVRLDVEDGR